MDLHPGGGRDSIALYYAMPTQLAYDALYSVVGIGSVVLILVAIRVVRPEDPKAWYLVATAGALLALGDLVGDDYSDIVQTSTPVPSISDAFYLCAYPFLFLGVIRLAGTPTGGRPARTTPTPPSSPWAVWPSPGTSSSTRTSTRVACRPSADWWRSPTRSWT